MANPDLYPKPVFVSKKWRFAKDGDVPSWFRDWYDHARAMHPEVNEPEKHSRAWQVRGDMLDRMSDFPVLPKGGRRAYYHSDDEDMSLDDPAVDHTAHLGRAVFPADRDTEGSPTVPAHSRHLSRLSLRSVGGASAEVGVGYEREWGGEVQYDQPPCRRTRGMTAGGDTKAGKDGGPF